MLLKMFRHYTVVLFLLLLLLKKLVVSNASEGKDQEHFRSFDKDLVGTVEDNENFFKILILILASLVFYLYVTKLLPQRRRVASRPSSRIRNGGIRMVSNPKPSPSLGHELIT